MERAASSSLPHPSGFSSSALQSRLQSSSCSGSPVQGSALLLQVRAFRKQFAYRVCPLQAILKEFAFLQLQVDNMCFMRARWSRVAQAAQ